MSEPPSATSGKVTVTGTENRKTSASDINLQSLCELALMVLADEGVSAGQLDLHLVDKEAMAELNEEHMGHTGPTDVLSFPLDGAEANGDPTSDGGFQWDDLDGEPMLGDVVLCPEVAEAQAPGHVGSVDGEYQLLVIHGVLHVLGHDHAEPGETERMRSRERVHLDRLGVRHPEPA